MHTDARKLENDSTIKGDLCIVGAGAAGISIAREWMDTSHRVILLEGGGFSYDEEVQELYKGKTTGREYFPLQSARLHYFGGTTGHWGGLCSTYDDIDFKERPWVPYSGWPISRNHLDPFYKRAHKVLNLGPYEYDVEYWQDKLPNMKALPLDKAVIRNKMWQFNRAKFRSLYRDEMTQAENIHLFTYANVVDIKANDSVSKINKVIVKNHAGKSHTIKAEHFILACGAIQNARLLLASNSQVPHGLGNEHDLVGRYFMEHVEIVSAADLYMSEPFNSNLYVTYDKDFEGHPSAELGITEKVQRKEKMLNGTAELVPIEASKKLKPAIDTWREGDPRKSMKKFLQNLRSAIKREEKGTDKPSKVFTLKTRMEQAPNPDSRVTLGDEKDELGVPRAHLHWELTDRELRSIRTLHRIIGREVGKAGLGRVRLKEFLRDPENLYWPEGTSGGWHHMGTTRMSNDPKKGVVDANCKIHGLANLYVAGSGCYVTAGAANPTLTLVALSLRLSDHVKREMG